MYACKSEYGDLFYIYIIIVKQIIIIIACVLAYSNVYHR